MATSTPPALAPAMVAGVRPRRTPTTDLVLRLPGGTEDNDLWVRRGAHEPVDGGGPWIESVWSLTDSERLEVLEGANIVLRTSGERHPPVAMYVTDEKPGRA